MLPEGAVNALSVHASAILLGDPKIRLDLKKNYIKLSQCFYSYGNLAGVTPRTLSTMEPAMKRFPGKVIMAAIILSCGFVMQVEQSERTHSKQAEPAERSQDLAYNAPDSASGTRYLPLQNERSSW